MGIPPYFIIIIIIEPENHCVKPEKTMGKIEIQWELC